MDTEDTVVETGTTTVGLTTAAVGESGSDSDDTPEASDASGAGVVLAADRRASLGGRFVSNKNAVKIEQVHPRAAVTMSGSVGGAQEFIRQLRVEADLYETRRGREMSIDALSQLAGNLLRGKPASPLLGGVERDGTPRLFSVDGAGGVLEDAYGATGSGMTVATGTLERRYREDLSMEEGVEVAAEAVAAASERDTASGNGITVARLTADNVDIDSYDDTREVLER